MQVKMLSIYDILQSKWLKEDNYDQHLCLNHRNYMYQYFLKQACLRQKFWLINTKFLI